MLDHTTARLCAAIEADPLGPQRICVVAPGGHGKSVIINELADAYRRAGVQVVTTPGLMGTSTDAVALVIDDAHLLDETWLRRLADAQPARLVLGYRPWPRSRALAALTALTGSVVLPAPFDREQVAAFLVARLEASPSDALVEFIHTQTGGVPRFVEYAASWAGAGGDRDTSWDAEVTGRLRLDLDQLDADVERFLLAADAGAGLHIELLSDFFGRDSDAVGSIMAAARATGLLDQDGALLPITRRAIGSLVPVERRAAVRQRLAELHVQRGGSVLALARSLLGTGVVGASMAAIFHAAAVEALGSEPALAAKLFAAAVAAGSPFELVATGWAEAAARCADVDTALRLADQVIAADGSVERARAAGVAAAALAHRGQLGRSAELYRWVGTPASAGFAAIGLIGTGQPAAAAGLLDAVPANGRPDGRLDGLPTLLAGAASLMAHGVRQSLDDGGADALAMLVRAATLLEPTGRAVLLPDSPAALAALVALHGGELGIADAVLQRAVAAGMGGALLSNRHRLLRAWICMIRGQTGPAAGHLAALGNPDALEPRDMLFAVGLEVGLARRASDLPGLHRAWERAGEAVLRQPVDLFNLLPLGEFAVAAARLRDQNRLATALAEAHSLLAALGNPVLWATPLHWSGLHAAIIAEQPDVAAGQAKALGQGASRGRYGAALASAADCWLQVVAGTVDPSAVETAARGLQAVGLCWDGARLAGQAAIRTADRKAMVQLLDCARQLQGPPARSVAEPADNPSAELSEREREVADLVLAGLTYKQIGNQLFISAKTVEHHVARMRQKLGCASRSELLAQLRAWQ